METTLISVLPHGALMRQWLTPCTEYHREQTADLTPKYLGTVCRYNFGTMECHKLSSFLTGQSLDTP